jgi:hypothetical protein
MRHGSSEKARSTVVLDGRWLVACVILLGGCASAAALDIQQDSSLHDGGTFDLSGLPDLSGDMATSPQDLTGADLSSSMQDMSSPGGCTLASLKVNEVSTAGPGGATDEYVELYNPCSAAVALVGGQLAYRAAAASADTFALVVFTSGQSIASHGYFLVANGGYAASADVKPFAAGATGLAAAGGGVALEGSGGTRIDSVGWGTATNAFVETAVVAAPGTSQSAARHPDGTDTNDNATDFEVTSRSPGAAN